MTPSLEGWPIKAKEAPSTHEVRLAPLDTNPVFQNLRDFHLHYKIDNHLLTVNFSIDDIAKILQNLDPNKAHGHDKISI